MSKLVGVVEKPQFDTEVFKPGKAIHVKKFDGPNQYRVIDVDGLIGEVNPLSLTFYYYHSKDYELKCMKISIDSVIDEKYKIALLKEENK